MATRRSRRWSCPRKTVAMPPRPSSCSTTYRPARAACRRVSTELTGSRSRAGALLHHGFPARVRVQGLEHRVDEAIVDGPAVGAQRRLGEPLEGFVNVAKRRVDGGDLPAGRLAALNSIGQELGNLQRVLNPPIAGVAHPQT